MILDLESFSSRVPYDRPDRSRRDADLIEIRNCTLGRQKDGACGLGWEWYDVGREDEILG